MKFMKLARKVCPTSFSRTGWLLACALGSAAQADVGPALSGITAQANDASTVFWSPAGITRIEQPELVAQATLVAMDSKFNVKESNRPGGDADSDFSLLPVPGVYYAHPLNERWSAGVSMTAPAGFGNDYGKTWSGRYLDEYSELAFLALTGTLGYELTDRWSIGGGPIIMYAGSTSQARVNNLVGPDGKVKLEEDGFGFGWQLGLMYDISDTARVGAVYRAKIDMDLSGKPHFKYLGPGLKNVLQMQGLLGRDIDVDFEIPQLVQVGYFQEFKDDWSFTLDAIWLDTSEFGIESVSVGADRLSLPAEFKDAWAFMVGLRHEYRPDLAFSVGAAYLSSAASKSKRSLALPLDRVIAVGAGVEWQWKGFEVHSSLNYADLGDGKLDQDGGPAGRVKGSFDRNYAVVLDTQLIKRF
jgi:long-chain fatty acid transport protein